MSVCLIVPFSNDEYIPALPDIAHVLVTSHSQWVMSVFFLGMSVSQLFYGPLLDRFGRRLILIVGLIIFNIGSFLAVVANSIEMLLLARFIQALGASSGIVSVFAIIRDVYPPEKIIKMTAYIMGIIAICPTVAPIIGNILQVIAGWRACFGLLLVLGVFYLIIIVMFLQETQHEKNYHAIKIRNIFFNYAILLRNTHFLGYLLISCFSYASLFCYFAVAPFFLINLLHVSVAWVGLIIAINAIPLLTASYVIGRVFKKLDLIKSSIIGSVFILAGGIFMVMVNFLMPPSLPSLVMPMLVSAIGVGIIRPSASAGAMRLVDKKIAGSASAMFSFFSFIGAAFFTVITTKLSYHSLQPFGILLMMLGAGAVSGSILTRLASRKLVFNLIGSIPP